VITPACPYLTGGDGSWRSAFAARGQRCAAVAPPTQLALSKQRQLCLLDAHASCATFLAARALERTPADDLDPADAFLWPASRPTLVAIDGVRGGGGAGAGGADVRRGGQALLVGLMVLAFLVLVIARTTTPSGGSSPVPGTQNPAVLPVVTASVEAISPTPAPSPSATGAPASDEPSVSPPASAGASASPSGAPSPSATASPRSSPTSAPRSPTPSPSPTTRYTVQSGDTLSGIAAKFGITVTALKRANKIGSSNLIHTGQVLVIP
jgi:LysM repeat protein